MRTRTLLNLSILICLLLLIAAGCAPKTKYSGFMDSYPEFKSGKKGVDRVWVKEGVDFSKYDKIMMDYVEFRLSKDSKDSGIRPDEMRELSDLFHRAMVDALGNKYTFVSKPGPDVLRVRPAITGVYTSKPGLNAITAVVPVGLTISIVKKGVTGSHTFVGGASMEMELVDSMTNKRVAAAIDKKTAEKYKIFKGMVEWGHAEDAFKFWAKRFRIWLDDAHEKK